MYMDFLYDEVEIDEVLISRLLAGVFFTLASTYVLAYIGPVSSTALIKKDIAEQKNRIRHVRNDASYSKLLQKMKDREKKTKKQITKQMAPHQKLNL